MSLKKSLKWRGRFNLFTFGLLYFVQGAALAYFRNFQKPYLGSLKISANEIGILTSILLFPFIIKIFIGMLSDKVSLFGLGNRKPYILGGLLLGFAAFFAVSYILPEAGFLRFSVLIVIASFSIALFDSATDGYAIDITPQNEYGCVQGVMVGGRAFGFIILSLLFGYLVGQYAYTVIFKIVALMMLIPVVFLFFMKSPPLVTQQPPFEWKAFRILLQPQFMIFALYAVFYSIISFGVDGLVTYFMSEQFAAPEQTIGHYGALRGGGAVIGAILGGILMDKKGHRPVAYVTALVISLGAVFIAMAVSLKMLLILGVIWGFAWGFQETVFVALAMGIADARIAASMFAIMMAFSNIGTAITEGLTTALSDDIGFRTVFLILAGLNLFTLLILYLYFKKQSGYGAGRA